MKTINSLFRYTLVLLILGTSTSLTASDGAEKPMSQEERMSQKRMANPSGAQRVNQAEGVRSENQFENRRSGSATPQQGTRSQSVISTQTREEARSMQPNSETRLDQPNSREATIAQERISSRVEVMSPRERERWVRSLYQQITESEDRQNLSNSIRSARSGLAPNYATIDRENYDSSLSYWVTHYPEETAAYIHYITSLLER